MPNLLRSIVSTLFIVASLTASAFACPDDRNPAPSEVSDSLYANFMEELNSMGMQSFTDRYCALNADERALAVRIFGSAYENKNKDDRYTLLRMAIMVPDIAENVAWVAENARIREEGDDWESVSIKRFVSHVRNRFPKTRSVLDDAYLTQMDELYQRALDALRQKEQDAEHRIDQAETTITDYEKQIEELRWKIEKIKDERRDYRVMLQALETEQ